MKAITEAIGWVARELGVLAELLRESSESGGDPARLASLESRIEAVVGMVDAGLVKAESLKAAARAAEDRERGHMKRAEAALELAQRVEGGAEVDPFDEVGRAYADLAATGDAPEDVLQAVPSGLEDRRAGLAAVRAKKRA